MNVDPEVAHKNVERDLRLRRDQYIIGVVLGMIEIKGVADTEIETQGVQLGYGPDGVERQIRSNDDIILRIGSYSDETRTSRVGDHSRAIVGIVDVVVGLGADGCSHSKSNWTQQ